MATPNGEVTQDPSTNPSTSAISDAGDLEPYYVFESDPLVLKNNPDYQQLLRCQMKLQAQRITAVKVSKCCYRSC